MRYTARPYRDRGDLAAILGLLERANAAAPSIFHLGDVVWGMFQNTVFDPHKGVYLWSDGEQLAGFSWHDPVSVAMFLVAPGLPGRAELERAILGHAEQLVRTSTAPGTPEHALWVGVLASDAPLAQLLQSQQYALDADFAYALRRDLAQPLPDAPLPEGFVVRAVGGEDEWAARVDLHRAVWHPSRVTLEAYRRLRAAPVYDPELDLVAVAPDGTPLSYCICWLDRANRVGEFEPVGTHPDHHRRGLGRAVLAEGLRRLRERGAQAALVYAPSERPPAQQLYRSVGFVEFDRHLFYTKPL